MKLKELQDILAMFYEGTGDLSVSLVSRLKSLVIERYEHEEGTYQMANFTVTIVLE
jgi:hypothetical protein